ncbi:unnamed protein product [Rhodiola kirilowii]
MAVIELSPVTRSKKLHQYFFRSEVLPLQSNKQAKFMMFSLPTARLTRFMARLVFLTFVIASFPWIGSVVGRPLSQEMSDSAAFKSVYVETDASGFGFLPKLFRDLRNDGILRGYEKSLVVAGDDVQSTINEMMNFQMEMEMVSSSDVEKQNSLPEEAFDIAFINGETVEDFVDRSLKPGGVAAVRVNDESVNSFQKPNGYTTIYLRKFSSNSFIIVLKKTSEDDSSLLTDQSPTHRHLFGFATEARKAALKKLEDVLLEPPRASSGKSRTCHKRTKYLPDLLGDSLESYPRRVFIDVGLPEKEGGSGSSWFDLNYPTRNLDFEKYKIETVTEESSGKEVVQIGMSDWLQRNVKEEEYVVMKAEAEAVEEMVKSKAIRLIDELFMECRPRGLSNSNQNRRAYWECLALYGKLRDEGVAVHQWWG